MSPSDSAIRPRPGLWLPLEGCLSTPDRVSQVPDGSVRARCLLSPRGVRRVHRVESSSPVLASPSSAGWPLPVSCIEAEPSSRDATARAFTFPSFNGQDRSHPLKGRLYGFRPFTMINTLQLTRTTRLSWRFPNHTNHTNGRDRLWRLGGGDSANQAVEATSTRSLAWRPGPGDCRGVCGRRAYMGVSPNRALCVT